MYEAIIRNSRPEQMKLFEVRQVGQMFHPGVGNFIGFIETEEFQSFHLFQVFQSGIGALGGIPIFRAHEYELKSVYDNTSGEDQDSMAVMFLYVHDRGFRLPRAGPASKN